jgi:hypothetical protein
MARDIVRGRTKNNLERLDVLLDGAVDNNIQGGVSEEADDETTFQEEFVAKATNNIDNSNNVADFIQDDNFEGNIRKGVSEERNKESSNLDC